MPFSLRCGEVLTDMRVRTEQEASTRAIILLAAAAFCSAACMRFADPLLPAVAHEFSVSVGSASVIATAFSLAYGLCQIVYGPIGDRFGKFALIALAMTAASVAVALTATVTTLAGLAGMRLVTGAAAAAVIPLAMAFIGDRIAYEQRQATLARFLSGQIMGLVFGQAVGGIILEMAGWRPAFLILAGVFAVVTAMLWLELRSGRVAEKPGTGTLRVGRLARQYTNLLVARRSRAVLTAVSIEGALFFGAFAYIGAYLRGRFDVDYVVIGVLLAGFGLGGLAYSATARRILATLGEAGMVRVGGAILAVSFALLAVVPTAYAVLPVSMAIGFGFYMMHNTLQTNATQMAPEARGSAVSLFALAFFLSQAIGVAAAGVVIDRLGYSIVFVTAGLGLLALSLWFAARRTRDAATA